MKKIVLGMLLMCSMLMFSPSMPVMAGGSILFTVMYAKNLR